jgi:arginine N-succinyltransferase
MIIVRPVTLNDLDQLERLAIESGPGMTNLPANRDVLERKIRTSLDSFSREVDNPGEESYLLVMEDTSNQRIAGTSGIIASVGLSRPFYSYRVIHLAHTSLELNKYDPVGILQMVNEYRGDTEIATLYLTPDYRRDGNGKLLSRCRFLFMAQFPQRFAGRVMAEMRGVHDEQGRSIFWDSLGRHFLDMDFSKADYLSALGKYQFIADLMPHYPIYIRLLPREAQAVIGIPHETTRPALALLEREGFRFEGCIDVFDAGPTIHAPLAQIRTVRESAGCGSGWHCAGRRTWAAWRGSRPS